MQVPDLGFGDSCEVDSVCMNPMMPNQLELVPDLATSPENWL